MAARALRSGGRAVSPALALALGLALASPAHAAPALATSDLNLRAGPATRYPVIATIPRGGGVEIEACLADVDWCDVSFGSERGWASARYLAVKRPQGTLLVPNNRGAIGLPTTTFSQRTYWDRHYRQREVYQDLSRWEDRYSTHGSRLNDGSFGRYERPSLPSPASPGAGRTGGWDPGEFRSRARPPALGRDGIRQGPFDSRGAWRGLD